MTASHQHRTLIPSARRAQRGDTVARALDPTRHAPEIQLALAALLVVLAGPVARAFAPTSVAVAGASVVLLAVGILLAVLAAISLLRTR